MAPRIRRYCASGYFDALDEEFLNEHSSQHIRSGEENGTHTFSWLRAKGYLAHIGSYHWVVNPRVMELCNTVVDRISELDEAEEELDIEVEERGGPCRNPAPFPTALGMGIVSHVVYLYRGTRVDRDIYYQLKEDGLSEHLTVEFYVHGVDTEEGPVDPQELLLSLLEERSLARS